MPIGLRLATPPASEPIDVPTAKAHLRVDVADDDPLITNLIASARDYFERETDRRLVTQTWDQVMDSFPIWPDPLELKLGPVQSVTSVTYVDSTGATQTWAPANYVAEIAGEPARIQPAFAKLWPTSSLQTIGAVTVRYVVGYASAAVPKLYNEAVLGLIGHWYENRETVAVADTARVAAVEVPLMLHEQIRRCRVPWVPVA